MVAEVDTQYKKKQKALQKKVKSLGTDNPVVERAVDSLDPKRDAYEDFEPVHELVSAACSEYQENGDLKGTLKNLGKAIAKLASGK